MPNYNPWEIDWSTLGRDMATSSRTSRPEFEYIHSHDYNPDSFNFHKMRPEEEELYFGAEIEVDCGGRKDKNAEEVVKILGDQNVYIKHDGSLSDGFEIVTHPATLFYHQNMDYKRAFDFLVKQGYRAHNTTTCGLHIHFNRSYFGKDKLHQDMCISKLLYVFEKFYKEIELIARRKHNDYARRYYLENNDTVFDMYTKAKNANKYGAINLKHEDTIEIRIFKGTLNVETFLITLQFVRNIIKIVKKISIYDIQYVTWDSILNKFTPELKKYFAEKVQQKREEDLKKEAEENARRMTFTNRNEIRAFDPSLQYVFPNDSVRFVTSTLTTEGDIGEVYSYLPTEWADEYMTEERRDRVRDGLRGISSASLIAYDSLGGS